MSALSVSDYQEARWMDLLASVVDSVRLQASGVPTGSTLAVTVIRRGLLLVNEVPITLSAGGATDLGFYDGATLLYTLPWTGGTAHPGQLALQLSTS